MEQQIRVDAEALGALAQERHLLGDRQRSQPVVLEERAQARVFGEDPEDLGSHPVRPYAEVVQVETPIAAHPRDPDVEQALVGELSNVIGKPSRAHETLALGRVVLRDERDHELARERAGVGRVDGVDPVRGIEVLEQERAVEHHRDQVAQLHVVDDPGARMPSRELAQLPLEKRRLDAAESVWDFGCHHTKLSAGNMPSYVHHRKMCLTKASAAT